MFSRDVEVRWLVPNFTFFIFGNTIFGDNYHKNQRLYSVIKELSAERQALPLSSSIKYTHQLSSNWSTTDFMHCLITSDSASYHLLSVSITVGESRILRHCKIICCGDIQCDNTCNDHSYTEHEGCND